MVRRCFMAVMLVAVALQSAAFMADMELQHHSLMPHFEHAHVSATPEPADTSKGSPNDRSHSSDHCHHSHVCFHTILTANVTHAFSATRGLLRSAYRAQLTGGVQASPFRPPIA